MKHLFLMATLLLSIFCIKPAYSEPLVDVTHVIQKMEHSVFIAEVAQIPFGIAKGSIICVKKTNDATWFITAKHVVENAIAVTLSINNAKVIPDLIQKFANTDCAYIKCNKVIEFAVPVTFNLEFDIDKERIPTIAYGYWARTNKLTATLGYTSRAVCRKLWLKTYNYEPIEGVIFGQNLLFGGYSGGALTDENGNLVGLNIVLSSEFTIYVDARYIWNELSFLNESKKVEIPYSDTFNIFGPQNDGQRLYLPKDSTITIGSSTFSIDDFNQLLDNQSNVGDIDKLLTKIEVHLPNRTLSVRRIEFLSSKFELRKTITPIYSNQYLTSGGRNSYWVIWVS